MAWRHANQKGLKEVKVFFELFLCAVHSLFVRNQRYILLPRIGVCPFDLKDHNMDKVSCGVGCYEVNLGVS